MNEIAVCSWGTVNTPSHSGDKFSFLLGQKMSVTQQVTQVQGCISDPELKHPKGSNHLGLTDTG